MDVTDLVTVVVVDGEPEVAVAAAVEVEAAVDDDEVTLEVEPVVGVVSVSWLVWFATVIHVDATTTTVTAAPAIIRLVTLISCPPPQYPTTPCDGVASVVDAVAAPGVVNARGSVQGEYPALLRARTWNTKLSPT